VPPSSGGAAGVGQERLIGTRSASPRPRSRRTSAAIFHGVPAVRGIVPRTARLSGAPWGAGHAGRGPRRSRRSVHSGLDPWRGVWGRPPATARSRRPLPSPARTSAPPVGVRGSGYPPRRGRWLGQTW